MNTNPKIFISYKRVDKDRVFEIKDYIEQKTNKKCWIDLDGIESDAQFVNVIIKAINNADIFLFMYSKSHTEIVDYDYDWTVREISFAQKKSKRIVFLNIDNTPLTDWFELMFGLKQQIDATSFSALNSLCKDLSKWLVNDASQCNSSSKKISDVKSSSTTTKVFTVNGVSFNMIRVDGGTFKMGGNNVYNTPVHDVTLSDYYIGETEVTQELWQAVMGRNPSRFKGNNQRPVEQVSWNDCQDFIRKLNSFTGNNFKLPTEAQWEFAARGGKKSKGYIYSGSNSLNEVAWYDVNSKDKGSSHPDYGTHPVKNKLPNELGLYDMSGNVWEWCSDYFNYYSISSSKDPESITRTAFHVFRGGSWHYSKSDCQVDARCPSLLTGMYRSYGLRLVLPIG